MKWTTYTISSLVGLIMVSGCLTQQVVNHKKLTPPPNPIQFQKTMELARKKPFKNPLLFRGANPRKKVQPKIFAATPPSLNLVLEWKTPASAIGIPVVYQVLCDTNISLSNPVVLGQTQGLGFVDQIDLAKPHKFYKVQTLAAVTPDTVTLSWDQSTEPTITGYRLFYGDSSRSYTNTVDCGAKTSVVLTNLTAGTYYAAITCYTSGGLESDFSAEIPITITTVPPITAPGLIAH